MRIDPDDIGAVSVLIDRAWVDAPCVQGDLHGVTLDAWRLQLALINQRYRDQAALSRSIREETIASIRATNAQRVALLLPGSLSVTQEQITPWNVPTLQESHGRHLLAIALSTTVVRKAH